MTIVPVIDVLDGLVVHAIAGRRDSYRPIETPLSDTSNPLEIASAFHREFGFNELYLADLNGLLYGRPDLELLRSLAGAGFDLLTDVGLREKDQAGQLFDAGVRQVVAALEASPGPDHLRSLVESFGPERVAFSLDLLAGRPLVTSPDWQNSDPVSIADVAVECGVAQLIVLDLAGVGRSQGVSTLPLCHQLRQRHPHLSLITGGGVHDGHDVDAAEAAGVDRLLIASALHCGPLADVLREQHRGRSSSPRYNPADADTPTAAPTLALP